MKTFKRRFPKISFFLFLIMSFILFNSCKKDKDVIPLPVKMVKFGNTITCHYSYDSQNRLVEIDSDFSLEQIDYKGCKIYKWTVEKYQNSETSEHFYYYDDNLIDSIRNTNPSYYEIELEEYIHDGNRYLKKLRYSHGILSTTSIFQYESDRIISETYIMHEASNFEIIYTFKYDELGNLTKIFHDDYLTEEYEFTNRLNPLYLVSTPYLEKTPIGFYEFNPIYTKYLVAREKDYIQDGTLQHEVIYDYTFNENQQPTHASIEINQYFINQYGTDFFEYEY